MESDFLKSMASLGIITFLSMLLFLIGMLLYFGWEGGKALYEKIRIYLFRKRIDKIIRK